MERTLVQSGQSQKAIPNSWQNGFEYQKQPFEETKAYRDRQSRVSAIVHMPTLKEETFRRDLSDMLQARLIFDEALATASPPVPSCA
jgi:hypothetical protein